MSRPAATIFDRNLVVTAGAGTGKTALLVERTLNLVAGPKAAPVDSLALITFTEKAAAELRERLASALDELRALAAADRAPVPEPERATEALRSFAWLRAEAGIGARSIESRARAALTDLDAATVSTIHAFCAEILRRFPREAGVDPSFQVDEGASFDAIFDEEWERFLLEELGERSPRAELWKRALLFPGGLAPVRSLARSLASFGLPAQGTGPPMPAPARRIFGDEAAEIRDRALAFVRAPAPMNPGMKNFLSATAVLLEAFLRSGPEEMRLVTSPLSIDDYLDKDPAPGAKLGEADAAEALEIKRRGKGLIAALAQVDEPRIALTVEAAAPLAGRTRERLLAAGLVTYDALLRLARDLVAGHVAVRRALAARWRSILVDEFQDTDPMQYEILFFLCEEEPAAAADAWSARLAPGRLFIVGDPKQSIYRFRGADMEAYQRAVRRVLECGGERLSLSVSYRSPAAILDPINRVFSEWIGPRAPSEGAFEPAYEPIESAREGGPGTDPRVEIWTVTATGNAADRRRAEAGALAAFIASSAGGAGAPLRFRDVAILFRALTHAPLYTQALRHAGIPFVVEGGRDFYERQEVGDLISFLRAASNPNDAAAVLAVMRSPLGGVPDAELARYAAAGGRLDRTRPPHVEGCDGVRRTLSILAGFRGRNMGGGPDGVVRPPDEIVRAALEETPIGLLHASAFEGAQRVANLRKLVARAEDLGRRGLSIEETLFHLEDEFRGERAEGESPLADETVDAVRLLSVHKAKGLEYPVVLVPDVGRRPHASPGRGAADSSARWLRHEDGGWLAVRLADGTTNLAWAKLADLDRRHDLAEEKRVFYVACTRARERLILVNSDTGSGAAPWRDALGALGYDVREAIPPAGLLGAEGIAHRVVVPASSPAAAGGAALDPIFGEAARSWSALVERVAAESKPPLRRPTGEREAREEADRDQRRAGDFDLPFAGGRDPVKDAAARRAGSAVHAALEIWDFKDPAALGREAGRAAERFAEAEGLALRDPVARERVKQAIFEETGAILEGFLASALPARLAQASILGREIPVLFDDGKDGGGVWRGYCDLVYRETDGTIVVADYKTSRTASDAAAAETARSYKPQLDVYREAVERAIPGARVRAEILFVRSGRVVRL